jgi:geranylgeranyl diphosphate synthase type II
MKPGALETAESTADAAFGLECCDRARTSALGEAYQVADDLADVVSSPDVLGKPVRQDAAHERPSAVAALGLAGARVRFFDLLDDALAQVPPGPAEVEVRSFLDDVARRFEVDRPRRVAAI